MKRTASVLCLLLTSQVQAQWQLGPAIDVTAGKAFHHLEASGRQAIAVSGNQVAITWEDDRSGAPRCYVAIKADDQAGFKDTSLGKGECFAPGIVALDQGRFGLIWEDASGVNAGLVAQGGVMTSQVNLSQIGGQGALGWQPDAGLVATWSEPEGRWRRLWLSRLKLSDGQMQLTDKRPVDPEPAKDDQMYPAMVGTSQGLTLAWEDRRLGHTVIFASQSQDGAAWSAPIRVSRNPTGKAQGTDLGRGTGAMRPALAAYGNGNLAIVWLDKRDFLSGYDVYAALRIKNTFGKNLKVQDSFGDAIAQWHPAVAGNAAGELVVAWDDDRDGSPDIWLSELDGEHFTDNISPTPASGPLAQTDPAITLDDTGRLHLVWIERDEAGLSRIRYTLGQHPLH